MMSNNSRYILNRIVTILFSLLLSLVISGLYKYLFGASAFISPKIIFLLLFAIIWFTFSLNIIKVLERMKNIFTLKRTVLFIFIAFLSFSLFFTLQHFYEKNLSKEKMERKKLLYKELNHLIQMQETKDNNPKTDRYTNIISFEIPNDIKSILISKGEDVFKLQAKIDSCLKVGGQTKTKMLIKYSDIFDRIRGTNDYMSHLKQEDASYLSNYMKKVDSLNAEISK